VSRIFMSHSSRDSRQAIALRQWLIEQDPSLAADIFLDVDPDAGIPGGTRWRDALRQASDRCEAVICLLSRAYFESHEMIAEFVVAETLNKQIYCVRLEDYSPNFDMTQAWQRCDLFVNWRDDPTTVIDLRDDVPPVVFSAVGLHRLFAGLGGAGITAGAFHWPPPNDPSRAPYRGWQPFEEADAAVYFGRDGDITRGLGQLRDMRQRRTHTLFAVIGPSGAGKSSFLRAGLLPRLRRDDHDFMVLDVVGPERQILLGAHGLAQSISSTRRRLGLTGPSLGDIKRAITDPDFDAVRELLLECQVAAFRRLLVPDIDGELPSVVLPLDQADDVFDVDAAEQARLFLQLLANLAEDNRLRFVVVATIRSDRYERMQEAPELAAVAAMVFPLNAVPPSQFGYVITGPAARASEAGHKLEIDPNLLVGLLADSAEGADPLPMLSLTMARLFDDYGSSERLTVEDYELMGGMRGVLQSEVDQCLSGDPETRRIELEQLRAAFIPWLTTIDPIRGRPVPRSARYSQLPQKSRPLVEKFVANRILRKDSPGGDVIVEVAAGAILGGWDELRSWIDEQRLETQSADTLEKETADWEASNRSPDSLLTGRRLREAESVAANPDFRERLSSTLDYLAASRRAEDQRLAADARAATQFRAATAARLIAEAEAMIAGSRPADDERAFQALLAADALAPGRADEVMRTACHNRRQLVKIMSTTTEIRCVAVSPDGLRILAGGDDAVLRLWHADSGQPLAESPSGHSDSIVSISLSPDGNRIVTASVDHTLRLWNSGTEVGSALVGHSDAVRSVAFSKDGRWIVSGSADGSIRIWDGDAGQPVGQPLVGHTGAVNSVAVSAGGRRIASAGEDGTIRVWDASTGLPIGAPMTGHPASVRTLDISGDGRIVSGGTDGTLRIWDAETAQPIGLPLTGHEGVVFGVALSRDGQRIVSGGRDGTVRLWDVETGQPSADPVIGHGERVWSVAFSPDGYHVVSGGADATVRVWAADPVNETRADPAVWRETLRSKLTKKMSRDDWRRWISPDIDYIDVAPDVPGGPDDEPNLRTS
jgi:hypothetical protein